MGKVSVSSEEVVQHDTLKVYDIKAPGSILGSDLGMIQVLGYQGNTFIHPKIPKIFIQ